ncbi:MAG: GcrA family cell cycle regulator [Hyphomicrobiaceae bacterium]
MVVPIFLGIREAPRSRVLDMSNKKPKHKTLLELEPSDCRWPVGDPRHDGFHFCGAQQVLGRPYCIEHWPMSFVPGKGRQGSSAAQSTPASAPALTAPDRKAA